VVHPAPFLRGAVFPPVAGIAYPRAAQDDRLPADTWAMASYPVGVRLEFLSDCDAVDVAYETSGEAGHRPGDGSDWSVWRGGAQISSAPCPGGAGVARLPLAGPHVGRPTTVYLPEGMRPSITDVRAVGTGTFEPAPALPRWISYGDSIAEGWVASAPALTWVSTVAREQGLDVANLGYAGAARGEIVSAEQIAGLAADVISIAYGTNCWSKIAFSADMIGAGLTAFLRIFRARHPETPIVVISPIVRPQGEATPNVLGTTLAELRDRMEDTVAEHIAAGDRALRLVRGNGLVGESELADGIHPNDAGHRAMATALGPEIARALNA
jgi:lysophospholipase L1-like esterase